METYPENLYKYFRFDPDGYSLSTISNLALWFGSARNLNDPFDTAIEMRLDLATKDEIFRAGVRHLKETRPDLNHSQRRHLAREQIQDFRRNPRAEDEYRRHFLETNYQTFGICCFTTHPDNLLMWSHYADCHKGFCVGFNCAKLVEFIESVRNPLILLEKIRYESEMPALNLFKDRTDAEWQEDAFTVILTKAKDWAYENEYRLINWGTPDVTVEFPPSVFSSVIMGMNISKQNKELLLNAIDNSPASLVVKQARKSNTDFALDIQG